MRKATKEENHTFLNTWVGESGDDDSVFIDPTRLAQARLHHGHPIRLFDSCDSTSIIDVVKWFDSELKALGYQVVEYNAGGEDYAWTIEKLP